MVLKKDAVRVIVINNNENIIDLNTLESKQEAQQNV